MEVSLFGPGVGECVLIKLPTDKWIIVDSFIDKESRIPIALKYLEELNLSPSEVVQLIVITHWHKDHIAGMSEVILACDNATVVIPSAFSKTEFTHFITGVSKDQSLHSLNSAKEMRNAMHSIQTHYNKNKNPPLLASEGQTIYKNELNGIDIVALSPSHHSEISSLMEVAELYEKFKKQNPRLHILKQAPNNNSIALSIKVKDISILLGGDLEEPRHNPDKSFGWSAVLKSNLLPKSKSILFKVPHHGSETGHHDDVWKEMLIEQPCSILTTFSPSSLPLNRDIDRIKGNSESVYLTSPPKIPKGMQRDKRLQKEIENFCGNINSKTTITGHVKATIDIQTGTVNIEKTERGMIQL